MRSFLVLLLGIIICSGTLYAASDSISTPPSTVVAKADSLQHLADSLEARAAELEQLIDTSGRRGDDFKSELKAEMDKLHTEMMNVKKKIADALHDAFSVDDAAQDGAPPETPAERIDVVIEERPQKKHNGSFIVALEYTNFDVAPLKQLATNDRSLEGKTFHFSDNQMLTFGLMGYYGKESNLRIGNGLYVGYKAYYSERFSDTLHMVGVDSVMITDSISILRVVPVYFGFLCEKAFNYDPINFFAGIMLGANTTFVIKSEQEAQSMTSFMSEDSVGSGEENYTVAFAPSIAWDVHGGIAFKLSNHFHIGIDGIVRFAYAYEGFGAGFGDFLSVNPGIRMRLTFGRAG